MNSDNISDNFLDRKLSVLSLPPLQSLPPNVSIQDVIAVLQQNRIGAVPIVENDKIIGIITERDLVQKLNPLTGTDDKNIALSDIMTKKPQVLMLENSCEDAIRLMCLREFRHVPLLSQDEKPSSMISVKDLLACMVTHLQVPLKKIGTATASSDFISSAHDELFGSYNEERGKRLLGQEVLFLTMRKIVGKNPVTIDIGCSVEEALGQMQANNSSSVVVTQFETKVMGIITERDFLFKVYGKDILGKGLSVTSIMTPKPHCLLSRQLIGHAVNNMFTYQYRHIIIVDDDGLALSVVGLLDVLKYFSYHVFGE